MNALVGIIFASFLYSLDLMASNVSQLKVIFNKCTVSGQATPFDSESEFHELIIDCIK